MPRERPVRLSLVLSGGSSLGAYHAGVASALVTTRNALAPSGALAIDAVGGASAGALVSLLAGWAVATSRDPVWLLREAWVERVGLDLLRGSDGRAPLSFDALRGRFAGLLEEAPTLDVEPAPVTVHASLTGLRGLTYPVHGLRGEDTIRAATYADWFFRRLEAGATVDDVAEPEGASLLDACLASAANPGGFAPRLLDRSDEREAYEGHGIDGMPDPATLWFTDGGLIQSEPVGRVLAVADGDPDAQRVAVLVDPRSEDPGSAGRWSDPDEVPSWVEGLQRSLAILPAHEMYEDLRRLSRDNARIKWVERLEDALLPHVDAAASADVRRVLEDIAEEEASLRPADHEPGEEIPDEDTLAANLHRALTELAGVSGKSRVEPDVISPLLLAEEGDGTPALLAGEILGDFGGFLDRDLRASDFDLGYASALVWLRDGLAATDLAAEDVDRAVGAVEGAHHADWQRSNRGAAGPGDFGWRARASAVRLGLQILRVMATEIGRLDRLAPEPVVDAVRRTAGSVRRLLPTRD